MSEKPVHKGWHSRGYLPHFDGAEVIQSVTFRLGDALPCSVVERWKEELAGELTSLHVEQKLRERITRYEDAGYGACWLRQACYAEVVQQALLHFDGERYGLLDWCIMPNHVHVMFRTFSGHAAGDVVHAWKGYSARVINQSLNRRGSLWAKDYHDRYIRDADHFENARYYIRNNPVKAGLCRTMEEWPWSSAGLGRG